MIDLIRNLTGARQDVQQHAVLFSCVLRFQHGEHPFYGKRFVERR